MAEMLSPGVYTSEADYSEYVSDASTCIIGMVGGARKGPIGVPTLVTSQAQMVSIFGKPVEGEYGVYSALAALSKASQLYYTRVVRGGIRAEAGVIGTHKIIYKAKDMGDIYNGIVVSQTKNDDDTINVIVKSKNGDILETFENCSIDGVSTEYIETMLNGVSEYITAHVQYSGSIKDQEFTLTGGSGSGAYARAGVEGKDKITFRSTYYESDLNGCEIVISSPDAYGYFDVTVKDGDEVIEAWSSVTLDKDSDRYIESVINLTGRIVCTVNNDESILFAEDTLTFNGGDNGISGTSLIDIIGEETGTGLYSFSNEETVDIDVLVAPGWTNPEVIHAALEICENRGECIFIADAPFGLNAQEVINWSNGTGQYLHDGFDSSYGALYWPWVKIADTYTKKNIWLPPSGYVAAQYAYNDKVGHPWLAPAGLERGKIEKPIGVEISPTKGERDAVYGNRNIVNPIANVLGTGLVIWGQKTMQRKPSSLDRVNVRRLLNYLKKTIGGATRHFVFEQNIESTWERWKNMVTPTLTSIKDAAGIYDYKIEIAPSAADIENNRMPVYVSVKPTKAAEFIPLTFNIMPYTASFDD